MAHICRLDARIIERIIAAVCSPVVSSPARLGAYKRLVALAAVCRAWRPLAQAYLASVLIVEFQPAAGSGAVPPSVDAASPPGARLKLKGEGASRALSVWRSARPSPSSPKKSPVTAAPAAAQWQSNIEVLLGAAGSGASAARLRVQSFEVRPDFAGLVGAMTASGFARCNVRSVYTIEMVDLSETGGSGGGSSGGGGSKSSSSTGVNTGAPGPDGAKGDRWWTSDCVASAAAYLARAMPAVRILTSPSWMVSAATRLLATHLASQYFGQLEILSAALASPVVAPGRNTPLFGHMLTTLQIQAGVLEKSGSAVVPAGQLQTLKLFEADSFFSWAPFAGSAENPGELVFGQLTTLSIDFAKDDVVSIADFYSALGGTKFSVRTTMGKDRRRVVLPALRALSVRKVPYTYPDAWRMFAESPLRKLAVAGHYGHVRHIDRRLLHSLDVVDIHMQAAEQAGGRFTSFVKSLLAEPCAARSAWVRYTEPFPVSVPDVARWTQLEELNICGYLPALALPALVARLPCLRRLV
ncbi:hypothetical protein IWQ56_004762, partial [Coemansia nantahalensis]